MTPHDAAVVDTNVIAALKLYDPAELPGRLLLTAVTLGELSFWPHATDDPVKRAGRVAVLQHVEATFDPLPYDQGAARLFGQICAAVRASGREPRKRASDLMIAAMAARHGSPPTQDRAATAPNMIAIAAAMMPRPSRSMSGRRRVSGPGASLTASRAGSGP